jgi:hypothetical protein
LVWSSIVPAASRRGAMSPAPPVGADTVVHCSSAARVSRLGGDAAVSTRPMATVLMVIVVVLVVPPVVAANAPTTVLPSARQAFPNRVRDTVAPDQLPPWLAVHWTTHLSASLQESEVFHPL